MVRTPTPYEADLYRCAITCRDEERLHDIFKMYPNVVWGSETCVLDDASLAWLRTFYSKFDAESHEEDLNE